MAVDKKISQLTSLAQVDVAASTDVLPIVDTSATETKKITVSALVGAGATAGLTNVDINSGTIDGTTIGASSASTGAFTTLSASGVATFSAGTAALPSLTTTGDTNTGVFFPAADTVGVTTGGSERLRVDSSGNVGIGTTTTAAGGLLTLNRAPAAAFGTPMMQVGGASFTAGGYYSIGLGFTDATYTEPPGEIVFITNSSSGGTNGSIAFGTRSVTTNTAVTERMRIDSSGSVYFGSTSGTAPTLYYSTDSSGGYFTKNSNSTGATTAYDFLINGTRVGSITTSGSATAYNTSSDYRLKENVQPMTNALQKIAALKPCTYTWKSSGEAGEGFIAHELAEVFPQAVTGKKDAVDADGKISPQGVDTSFLVATLAAAIQELKAENDALKARVEALEAK